MNWQALTTLFCVCDAYKILVITQIPGPSHAILGRGFVDTLSQAGHEVTYITPHPSETLPSNVRQVDASSIMDGISTDSIKIENRMKSPFRAHMAAIAGPYLARQILNNENVQELLMDTSEKFDVVIAEWFFTTLLSGFASIYKAPLIWTSCIDPHWQVLELIDEPSDAAYTAGMFTMSLPPFDFRERVEELFMQFYIKFLTTISHYTFERSAYNKYFGPAFEARGAVAPPYSAVAYNASFMFFNGHPVLSVGYRLAQNARYVGGYHINPNTKPLPENLKKIFDDAQHGVIYFSMGSSLQSKDMDDRTKQSLVTLFGTLRQTVLWKFEDELQSLPPNLHIIKWAPQTSILNHNSTVLFITHGGKLSTTEAVYYGVPVVGIPIFGDQFANMDQAVAKGYGLKVDYGENLADSLKAAIHEVTTDPSYSKSVKKLSAIFHDTIATPREEIAHWVEYVARTQGAPHLRSIALQVPWYQKIYLDLIAVFVVLFYILRKIIRWTIKSIYNINPSSKLLLQRKKKIC